MSDYKYEITMLAEDKAIKKYGVPYEDLSEKQQLEVFDEAGGDYFENKHVMADLREIARVRREG